MTDLLEKAFSEASRLSPEEQDALARRMLEDLEADRIWDDALGQTQSALQKLAAEARGEHLRGESQDLGFG